MTVTENYIERNFINHLIYGTTELEVPSEEELGKMVDEMAPQLLMDLLNKKKCDIKLKNVLTLEELKEMYP